MREFIELKTVRGGRKEAHHLGSYGMKRLQAADLGQDLRLTGIFSSVGQIAPSRYISERGNYCD